MLILQQIGRGILGAVVGSAIAVPGTAQSAPKTKFEVASIRACKMEGQRGGGGNSSPGRLNVQCSTVKGLIGMAYLMFANGRLLVGLPEPIEGGPGWINSESYEIDAKAEDSASFEWMHGPMLQALLEDRFNLKVHRVTRDVPVYVLTVPKNGPKIAPFKDGSCTPVDRAKFPGPLPPEQIAKNCHARGVKDGPNLKVDAQGMSVDDFAKVFLDSHTVDRPVINKTGMEGLFDFHLEYAPSGAVDDPAAGPSIFTALQEQLGLKLEPAKGPGEVLVIDSVGRPSAN